jgi:hypothetical protein
MRFSIILEFPILRQGENASRQGFCLRDLYSHISFKSDCNSRDSFISRSTHSFVVGRLQIGISTVHVATWRRADSMNSPSGKSSAFNIIQGMLEISFGESDCAIVGCSF